ncbi:MAG: hypothetical protein CM1200mP3_10180 [Chloroflexota bacterium]|nr:MAG: hypothetical protein CM1200mP3_10180 [Chloroflexota bacterium]
MSANSCSHPQFCNSRISLGELEPPKSEIVNKPLVLEEGFLVIPDAPGLVLRLWMGQRNNFPQHKGKSTQGCIRTDRYLISKIRCNK